MTNHLKITEIFKKPKELTVKTDFTCQLQPIVTKV